MIFTKRLRLNVNRIVTAATAAVLLLLAGPVFAAPTAVSDVRIGVHPDKTRLVIELTGQVPHRIFTLPDPFRVVIDLPQVEWRISGGTPRKPVGVVSSFRFGLFQKGNSRLVVDLSQPVKLQKHILLPPTKTRGHRLVVDLRAVSRAEFLKSKRRFASKDWVDPAAATPVAVRPVPKTRIPGVRPDKRVVVIDPGHGGPDPGAIGKTGLWEKIVTLRVAKAVKRVMERSGRYRVVLTRSEDVFVRLRRRFEIAEEVGAELFLSLHADSNRSRKLRGTSVYTLSENASDKEAAALAAKENRSDAIAGIDLSNQSDAVASFLIELRQRQTMNESAVFSEILIKEMGRRFRLLRNTHRFAGFAVLKSPDVPSVLVELGYLSNKYDERQLRSSKSDNDYAKAILRAADRYFELKEQLSRS